MRPTVHSFIGAVLAAFVFGSSMAGAADEALDVRGAILCSIAQIKAGECRPGGTGGGVTIRDTSTETGGTGGDEGSDGYGDSGGTGGSGAVDPSPYEICAATPGPRSDFCRSLPAVGVPISQPGSPSTSWSVTITDLARFVPSATTVAGEPDNVAVVGLPANFLSSAKTETIPGTILGRALTIRFTPISYAFDYGDGEQRTSTTPGVAWEAAGQAQFTPTDTSHVYKKSGSYTVTVTVTYTADVDLGAGWIPITGTLTGPPASQQIRVVKAYTALVQGTCTERPGAPGC